MARKKSDSNKTCSFGKTKRGRKAQLAAMRSKKKSSSSSTLDPPQTPAHSETFSPTETPTQSTSPQQAESASKRKLSYYPKDPVSESSNLPSSFVDLHSLASLFENLLCPTCGNPSLVLRGDNSENCGLAIFLPVYCTACEMCVSSGFTSKKIDGHTFDVNRRAVAASLATGMGYSGLCNFSEVMNIPSLNSKTYGNHTRAIGKFCDRFKKEMLGKVKLLKR